MKLLFQIALVGGGSAMGGLARWGVGTFVGRWLGTAFPWGTFLINITGCLFLGWFSTILSERMTIGKGTWFQADDLRLMIAVGFTGAYTTFSTFEYETHGLLRDAETLRGFSYLAASVIFGLLSVRLGIMLAAGR